MSRTLGLWYLNRLNQRSAERAYQRQRDYELWREERRRRDEREEADRLDRARSQEAQDKFDKYNAFHANLKTRRLDLLHSIDLKPITRHVLTLYLSSCESQVELGKLAGASKSVPLKDHRYDELDKCVDVRYSTYLSIRALHARYETILTANADLQVPQLIFGLFARYFRPSLFTEDVYALTQSNMLRYSQFLSQLLGIFTVVGERASAEPFVLAGSCHSHCLYLLRCEDNEEGALFRAFCPSNPMALARLNRMRTIYTLLRRAPRCSFGTYDGHATSFTKRWNVLLDAPKRAVIENGIQALIESWSSQDAVDSDWLTHHSALVDLYELYPIVFASVSALLLFHEYNPDFFDSVMNDLVHPDHLSAKCLDFPAQWADAICGFNGYFPDGDPLSNAEVATALSLVGFEMDHISSSGTITPPASQFPLFYHYWPSAGAKVLKPLKGALSDYHSPSDADLEANVIDWDAAEDAYWCELSDEMDELFASATALVNHKEVD